MDNSGSVVTETSDIVSPACHGRLKREPERFICASCKRPYPIINGIPNFIPELKREARETRESFDLQWEMSRIRGEYKIILIRILNRN